MDGEMVAADATLVPFRQAADAVELRHLRAFVAVAEELNFARAAERLYLSPPAPSRQISALERLVGCQVLRRSTHRVELTLAGEALLDRARAVLREVDAAVTATQSVGGELIGRAARLWEPMLDLSSAEAAHDEMRAAVEQLHAQFPPPGGVEIRPVNAKGVPSFVVSTDLELTPTVVYLHGGGYVVGSAFGYRHLAGALAVAAAASVLVPDYRLAPEHPFPAALDDAVAAYRWILDRGMPADQIALAGDSSGGGLVLSVLLALKQAELPLPGRAVLFCPSVDLSFSVGQPLDAVTTRLGLRYAAAYLAGHSADEPVLNPLGADLSSLPPLLIQAATGDSQLESARQLAKRAADHGVAVQFELYPTATHDFQIFWSFLPDAADAVERAGRFVQEPPQRQPTPPTRRAEAG
jgi:monoterpene epsilon-lactone hydrolase